MEHKIIVVGIGPGNPAYLLPIAKQAIEQATVLLGSQRALSDYATPTAKIEPITGNISAALEFITENLSYHDVTVMVSGDPGYYSLLATLRAKFSPERMTVIPGLSAMQLAFARIGLPWQTAKLVSFHGRKPASTELAYQNGAILGMLTDKVHNSQYIATVLQDHGWPATATAYICSRLSYEDEKISKASLQSAAQSESVANCIMVVTDECIL